MERSECNRNCWISAAIAGVLVVLFTAGIGDLSFWGGLFLGVVTAVLFGALMQWLVCHDQPAPLPPLEAVPPRDWQSRQAEVQPQALLVAAGMGPEPRQPVQMPIEAAPAMEDGDDLTRIKGIGPKLSDWLRQNGVTRYAQIAAWDAATEADFAQRLGRMGSRIRADDWVGQARALADGQNDGAA
ncbi:MULTISPECIES: hypothetical protein [unclassified Paracoccus (in: a-proteobacteria)]|uniref:hypothetical protein n=1 Tax=unclassified Paracoccus (in: a-proteobacteria) TaxID=2688777 RepID=UPI0012B190B6|nr:MULTISPECIES: hypothetical protein [unclassified Paracoccus (in: a-proteobacteria)]UXU75215.1 hypothetical protein GB879_001555 [Paracoccus sp. SMMA_5]UXU81117.1 hypothetical protein GB880_001550 [Paracoccus sp. SMMA_5_TC]